MPSQDLRISNYPGSHYSGRLYLLSRSSCSVHASAKYPWPLGPCQCLVRLCSETPVVETPELSGREMQEPVPGYGEPAEKRRLRLVCRRESSRVVRMLARPNTVGNPPRCSSGARCSPCSLHSAASSVSVEPGSPAASTAVSPRLRRRHRRPAGPRAFLRVKSPGPASAEAFLKATATARPGSACSDSVAVRLACSGELRGVIEAAIAARKLEARQSREHESRVRCPTWSHVLETNPAWVSQVPSLGNQEDFDGA